MEKSKQSAKARERRLKAKYRRNIRTAIVLCLILGLAGGFVLGRMTYKNNLEVGAPVVPSETATAEPSEAPATAEPTAEPEVTPTAAPTAEPTPEATEAAVKEVIVPFGTTQAIPVEIYSDGTVRKENDSKSYETLNFSLCVTRYLTTDYYQTTYGSSYNLTGTETGVEFQLTLNDYAGTQAINANNVLTTSLETADGVTEAGYKLVETEIVTEKKEVILTTNVASTLYKRFSYDATVGEMAYLVVTTYVDGECTEYKFELGEPVRPTATPAATVYYPSMSYGETSENVKKLQDRLIELGYLESGNNTGYYGNMTVEAVKKAQAAFGLEESGTADSALQQKLYE